MKRILIGALALLILTVVSLTAWVYTAGKGWLGEPEGPGEITERRIPDAILAERRLAQSQARTAVAAGDDKQILFGDFHVHTTFSVDAFFVSIPAMQGEGAHPIADACDFARYCSGLDFWSINDHAESLTPVRWQQTVEAIRQCNEVAGDPSNPDMVSFLGWEWTQVGATPADHFGHKNVVLADTEDGKIPTRPIAALGLTSRAMAAPSVWGLGLMSVLGGGGRLYDLARHLQDRAAVPKCEDGVAAPDLPTTCLEGAATPDELFRKLDEWGHRSIVIPHGTTWGFYTPPASTWDKQLAGDMHDPRRQTLIEVYSGHGNSEEYRDWRALDDGGDEPSCPAPSHDYLPSCWQAGKIIRERCLAAGIDADDCESRAVEARRIAAAHGQQAHLTVPGMQAGDWLDSGQCRDCFMPAFNYRPGGSAQYIMALTNFDGPEPRRFRFGFMASSDIHTARPGTGYKEYDRREMTEATGPRSEDAQGALALDLGEPEPRSRPFDVEGYSGLAFNLFEAERQASFFLTGGLVAVHADAKNRESIWQALDRREVYGTSGPRILLWFDLVDGDTALPMGSAVELDRSPRFRARAVGSFVQNPGCPQHTLEALSAERFHHLCRGECYNPSDTRRAITRIEVIRIRPQMRAGEPVAPLIEDPWKSLPCPGDPSGCEVAFEDADFLAGARDALYYVRAIEEPTQAVNAANLRCAYDAEGNCVKVNPCYGDWRTDYQDDCLAPAEERAWSSPIFVDYRPPQPEPEPQPEPVPELQPTAG
jgi:hypothetical protein